MNTQPARTIGRAFTLIELLVVIAIIAILAAILFPVFGAVREQTRQSSTLSNMHSIYVGASLFYQDEGRYPSALFGYAEVPRVADPNKPNNPPAEPALPTDVTNGIVSTPMDKATEKFAINYGAATGYLYHEQVKDFVSFLCADNLIGDQQNGKQQVTQVYYPLALTQALGMGSNPVPVVWRPASKVGNCQDPGDLDLPCRQTTPGQPDDCNAYVAGYPKDPTPKYFYTMDSMDIGPMINPATGKQATVNGALAYELHYSPDWTHELYNATNGCDVYPSNVPGLPSGDAGQPIVTQLKYKNPPTENTIITWNTWHAATAGTNNVLMLLASGTTRKISVRQAYGQNGTLGQLPLLYH